jgi:hypothetical protein
VKRIQRLLDQEPAINEFQMSVFEDLMVNRLSTLLIGLTLNGLGQFSVTGGKMPMLIVQIDDIYKIVEDSVLDRSLTRRETKSGLLVVPETHICCGKYQVGNIYSLGRCISMGLWMAISRTTDSSKTLNRLLLCRQHRKTHIFLMLLLTKNIQR